MSLICGYGCKRMLQLVLCWHTSFHIFRIQNQDRIQTVVHECKKKSRRNDKNNRIDIQSATN